MTVRKITAFLLAVCIMANLIPPVYAADGEEETQVAETTVPVVTETETAPPTEQPETEAAVTEAPEEETTPELPEETTAPTAAATEPPVPETEVTPETTAAPETEPEETMVTEPSAESETVPATEPIDYESEETADTQLAAPESVRLKTYEQFLAWYYLTYTALDLYLDTDEFPYNTYVVNADEDFEEALDAWRYATMGVGDLANYSNSEVEFYELMIFDILYQDIAEDVVLENVTTGVNALQSSLLENIANVGMDWTLDTKVTNENADQLLNQMIKFDNLSFLAGKVEVIKSCLEYTDNLKELITKLYMLIQLDDSTEEVRAILTDLYSYSTDPLMKEACQNVAAVSTGLMTDADIIAIFAGEVALGEVKKQALDKIWDGIMSSNALGVGMGLGQKIGKLVSNALCSTDSIVENWYSMQKVHIFEKVMKSRLLVYKSRFESNPTVENAKVFNKAVDMYLKTISVGMDYAIKYVEAANGSGLFGWIYKNFHKDEYENMLTLMNRIKSNVDVAIHFANNNILNFYMDSLEAEELDHVTWQRTTCLVTEEELETETAQVPEYIYTLSNNWNSENTTLIEDRITYANFYQTGGTLNLAGHSLTVYGDLYISGGTIDLAGGALNVRGNVYQSSGVMSVNGGTMKVGGDYRIQTRTENSDGTVSYSASSGAFRMMSDADHVIIGGDFAIQSSRHVSTSDSTYSQYTAGIMEVAGDFTQIAAGTSTVYNFNTNTAGTHTVVLNGTEPQRVSFAQNTSGFAYLQIAEGADVTFAGYLRVRTLQSDASVKSDGLILYNFNLNGHSFQITGDMESAGTVDLAGGTLTIDGNLQHTAGPITLNKGTLHITGDYKIQSTSGGESSGALRMMNEEDHVTVGGDFLTRSNRHVSTNDSTYNLFTAGTMEVAGDFTQLAAGTSTVYNFNTSTAGTHTVILNGTQPQRVSFEQNSSGFANLQIAEGADATFAGYLRVRTLQSDASVKSDGLKLYDFNLNGHSFQITGDTESTGTVDLAGGILAIDGNLQHTAGPITLNKGTLHITGDYKIQSATGGESYGALRMTNEEDHVIVGGDFLTRSNRHVSTSSSSYSQFAAGIMEVAGDFTQIKAGTSTVYNFNTSGTHTVILNGTEPQRVSFDQNSSGFTNLKIAEDTDVTFANYLRITNLLTDASVKSDGLKLYLSNLNGHQLNITGDTSVNAAMAFGGGSLNIIGDATISGDMTIGGGSLHVTGNAVTSGAMDFGGGAVAVGGNLTQTDGVYSLNKGTLEVTGDYRIQSASGSYSDGGLRMQYDEDHVIVGGDFVTQSTRHTGSGSFNQFSAGTMEFQGDFTQIPSNINTYYNFKTSGTHKVILNGTEPQRVTLGHTSAVFTNLEIAPGADVTFSNYLHVSNLLSDAAIKSDGLILYNFNLSGRTLHITGDTQMNSGFNTAGGSLTVQGDLIPIGGTVDLNGSTVTVLGNFYHRGGTLSVNKGTLKVLGDMAIQSASGSTSSGVVRMVNDEDLIIVFGDYICRSAETSGNASTQNAYGAGTLAVWGDVSRLAGHVYNMNLYGTKLFLMGTGPQSVTFTGATYNKLSTVQLRGTQENYSFSGITWTAMEENVPVPAEYFEAIPMLITQQPQSMEVGNQKTATVTVEAIGEGLTYAWYYRNPGSEKWTKSSSVTDTFTTTMDRNKDGREVYCVITDGNETSLQTDTVVLTMISESSIVITQQPEDVVVANGEIATVTVEATGEGLTYAWYYKNPSATSWSRSNSTTNSFSSSMDANKDGREIYCIITDTNGFTAQTDTVTVSIVSESSIVITKQPEDVAVPAGQSAVVTVEATGDGLTYAWYYKNPSATSWSKSNSTTNTFTTSMDKNKDGRQAYCVITDANGFTEQTNTVSLSIGVTGESSIVITKQPEDVAVPAGQSAVVTVKASGDGLTYTWFYKNPGASSWSRSNSTTNTFTTSMDKNKDGRQAYCVITDANGFTEQTNTVTLTIGITGESSIVITQQPEDVAVPVGTTAKVEVIAEGDGLTYAWFYKNPGATSWSRSNSKTNVFTTSMDKNKDGRQAYCVITDTNGFTMQTDTVTLTLS